MIGHNNKFVGPCKEKMILNFLPTTCGTFTKGIQEHVAIANVSEQGLSVFRAHRDEIHPIFTIIPSGKTDGPAVMRLCAHNPILPISQNSKSHLAEFHIL